jgi:GMP synthase PP-ATPase subunit
LLNNAIGKKLTCIFVNTGLLRKKWRNTSNKYF